MARKNTRSAASVSLEVFAPIEHRAMLVELMQQLEQRSIGHTQGGVFTAHFPMGRIERRMRIHNKEYVVEIHPYAGPCVGGDPESAKRVWNYFQAVRADLRKGTNLEAMKHMLGDQHLDERVRNIENGTYIPSGVQRKLSRRVARLGNGHPEHEQPVYQAVATIIDTALNSSSPFGRLVELDHTTHVSARGTPFMLFHPDNTVELGNKVKPFLYAGGSNPIVLDRTGMYGGTDYVGISMLHENIRRKEIPAERLEQYRLTGTQADALRKSLQAEMAVRMR
jgi:hypothetical protein